MKIPVRLIGNKLKEYLSETSRTQRELRSTFACPQIRVWSLPLSGFASVSLHIKQLKNILVNEISCDVHITIPPLFIKSNLV